MAKIPYAPPSRGNHGPANAPTRQANSRDAASYRVWSGEGDRRRRDKGAVRKYAIIAALCGLSAFIYAQFSHGMYSPYMTWMFLIPLLGGTGAYGLMLALHARPFTRVGFNAYNSGIATLAVASTLRGVFDIAGTSSPYLVVFVVVGSALIVFALIAALFGIGEENPRRR